MKRFILIGLMVLGSLLLYYVLGLNVVKLIFILLSQILPENIRSSQIFLTIMAALLTPLFAAGFTYGIFAKYMLSRWSDKSLSKEDAAKTLKITVIVASFFVAIANLYTNLSH